VIILYRSPVQDDQTHLNALTDDPTIFLEGTEIPLLKCANGDNGHLGMRVNKKISELLQLHDQPLFDALEFSV
jgi:hypothetical protein